MSYAHALCSAHCAPCHFSLIYTQNGALRTSPTPIAASLLLPATSLIYMEKTSQKSQFRKKSAKVFKLSLTVKLYNNATAGGTVNQNVS
jgi:hypothetical protein